MNDKRPASILLVDDNVNFLRIVTRFLDAHDDVVVVGAVCGGEEALTQVQDLKPDIVLIDIAMPNLLGGLQFVPRLRAALPGVGIIALTLLGIDGYRQAALEAGVDDFVPKVAMGADLLAAIRRVRQAHRTWEKIADFAGSTEV
jgi:DNA-binding NarL/FixJ family response regulator